MDMGFLENRIVKALLATSNRGMEPAMEWLLSHADDPDIDDPIPESTPEQPAEQKAPLTEQEKEEQKKKIEDKIKQRRQEREEMEKQEAKDREKRRMMEGKDMGEVRRKHDELEAKKMVDERKRQKADDKAAKAKVLAQIEADKARRKQMFSPDKTPVAEVPKPTASASPVKQPTKDYAETRLQMRLPDGSALVETFKAKEPLSAVRLYIQTNRQDGLSGNFTMQTTFPRRVFAEEDMEAPLSALDLVPSAVIMVSKPC